ncbi:unnamed protein product [marine sediment metagenome]|uniref:Nucleotidyl transferase AbiEii/AbiGii toxin family protein n=1 Tax=marine sediment metagenome TaxID=412755 RepID=X1CVR5_9ZZZZ
MKDLEKYYEENLYPLQDGVLSIVRKSGTPFFLTGGTALSRFYTHHRYSDDLDFFVANDHKYPDHVNTLLQSFINAEPESRITLERTSISRSKDYTQLFVIDSRNSDVELRIDLINDVAAHYGKIKKDPVLGRIDSIRNILSNKLTALFRSEPKDVVDIHVIAKQFSCNWKEIVIEAKSKEVGIEPETVYDLLMSFPLQYLKSIKWIVRPGRDDFKREIKVIADDILFGRDNSICVFNPKNLT